MNLPDPDDVPYIDAARAMYCNDDIEIDHCNVKLSHADGGAWVQAWLWVSNIEAGVDQADEDDR